MADDSDNESYESDNNGAEKPSTLAGVVARNKRVLWGAVVGLLSSFSGRFHNGKSHMCKVSSQRNNSIAKTRRERLWRKIMGGIVLLAGPFAM